MLLILNLFWFNLHLTIVPILPSLMLGVAQFSNLQMHEYICSTIKEALEINRVNKGNSKEKVWNWVWNTGLWVDVYIHWHIIATIYYLGDIGSELSFQSLIIPISKMKEISQNYCELNETTMTKTNSSPDASVQCSDECYP